jgi:hypothetical protein
VGVKESPFYLRKTSEKDPLYWYFAYRSNKVNGSGSAKKECGYATLILLHNILPSSGKWVLSLTNNLASYQILCYHLLNYSAILLPKIMSLSCPKFDSTPPFPVHIWMPCCRQCSAVFAQQCILSNTLPAFLPDSLQYRYYSASRCSRSRSARIR